MCVLLHLLICTALRAHIIVVEALYKINYYYYYLQRAVVLVFAKDCCSLQLFLLVKWEHDKHTLL